MSAFKGNPEDMCSSEFLSDFDPQADNGGPPIHSITLSARPSSENRNGETERLSLDCQQ